MDKEAKQRILDDLGGIPEAVYDELLNDLIKQVRDNLAELNKSLPGEDFDSISKIAHTIKGSSANLRMTKISEAAKALEISAKEEKDKQTLAKDLEALEVTLKDLEKEVEEG